MDTSVEPITLEDVKKAAERIRPFVHRTPIITCQHLNNISGKSLYFKCENFQKIGAFKIRGATNAVLNLVEKSKGRKPVIVTHSSGNHAQAVAMAAKVNELVAHVVMPSNSPDVKKSAVKGYGANIVECEPTQEQRELTAKNLITSLGPDATYLSPYDNTDIVAGQGTMGLEILEEIPDLDALVVPVGGGGMLSGICIAAKGINANIKIFAAEPLNADDCARSFAAKTKILNESPPTTVADGLRVNVGDLTWPIIRDNIEDVLVVTEEEIVSSMKLVFERMKVVIEASAAVGVAAVLSDKFKNEYPGINKVCVVLCGGNVDLDKLPWIK